MKQNRSLYPLLTIVCAILIGCGGGGGGTPAPTWPGSVSISTDRGAIDTGDRVQVTIYVSEVNDDGIMLKIRAPIGLSYVSDSGSLIVDNIQLDISPTVSTADTSNVYLVYFFTRKIFGDSNEGVIDILFDATAAVETGSFEVDPDLNDPAVSDSSEFDVTTPNFSAEDSASIVVSG